MGAAAEDPASAMFHNNRHRISRIFIRRITHKQRMIAELPRTIRIINNALLALCFRNRTHLHGSGLARNRNALIRQVMAAGSFFPPFITRRIPFCTTLSAAGEIFRSSNSSCSTFGPSTSCVVSLGVTAFTPIGKTCGHHRQLQRCGQHVTLTDRGVYRFT